MLHDSPGTRPGHDLRYSLDGTKLRDMGWKLPLTFEESLRRTISWTVANPTWMDQDMFMKSEAPPAEQPVVKPGANVASSVLASKL